MTIFINQLRYEYNMKKMYKHYIRKPDNKIRYKIKSYDMMRLNNDLK